MSFLSSRRNGRQPSSNVIPKALIPKWPSCLSAKLAAIALGVALVSAPRFAQAQTYTWGGTGSTTTTTDYNLGTNWSNPPAAAPPVNAGKAAVFDATGNATVSVTAGPITPNSWTFTGTSQSYTISGQAVNFNGAGPNLVNNANAGQMISISNNMTGVGISQAGASTLVLNGTNSFATATISAGTIKVGSTAAIGANSAVTVGTNASSATLDLNGFSNTIGSLSGNASGTVTNTGASAAPLIADNNNSSTTFSGNVVDTATASPIPLGAAAPGSLGLTKWGSGTLTLSGNNTYHGYTAIYSGVLLAGSTTAFSANSNYVIGTGGGQAFLDLNGFSNTIGTLTSTGSAAFVTNSAATAATLTTNALGNASTAFAGIIQDGNGSLGLTKNGTGTLTLSGLNTYTGATTVAGGTLALSGAGTIAASSLVTVGTGASATLDISGTSGASLTGLAGNASGTVALGNQTLTITAAASNQQFYGAINGAGGLTISGGAQVLGGANGYTGVTTINTGANLGILGTGSIANSSRVIDEGALDISVTLSGASIKSLSGTNGVVLLGSKTLTITAANDTFAGSIGATGLPADTGGLTLSGGTEKLTGTSHYTGATTINGGTLEVDGSIAHSSSVTVNSGGTLSGTGSVGSVTVNGGGTFAPGSGAPASIMAVSGSLAFQSGAFYLVQINPSTASFANVTGTATLGGATVNANFASGSYVARQYTILTAGNRNGTFGSVANTNLPSGFQTSLSYDTTHAYLNLALAFDPPPGSALNGNQRNVGNAISNFFNSNGSIPIVFGSLTPAGLTQLSGELATGSQQTTFDAMSQFMGVMTDPFIAGRGDPISAGGSPNAFADDSLADAASGKGRTKSERDAYAAVYTKAPPLEPTFEQRWSVWAAGFGGSQSTSGNAATGSNDTTSRIFGGAVGADYLFSPNTLAGFALAGGGTNFSVNGLGSGRSDLFQAGAYVRHANGPAYISAAAAYGWQDITTDRTVTIAGIDHLRAEFNANAWSGRVEDGYRFVAPWVGGLGITPYAAGQFTTFDLPAYAEHVLAGTGNFPLAYAAKSVTDTRSELGLRTDKSFAIQDGVLTLRGRFAWAHDFNSDRNVLATFQTLPGASFVVNGAAIASDSALTTASAEVKWLNGWSAAATFEGEFSNVTRSYAGKGVVRYAW
jgi:autotransporter-associated beta strand protein